MPGTDTGNADNQIVRIFYGIICERRFASLSLRHVFKLM